MKKKLKPIDPSTRARFMREKRCFEPAHQEAIDKLAIQLEDRIKMIAALEEALSNLKVEMAGMIQQATAEEMAKDLSLKAYREGETEAENRLRKEKRCFDSYHNFYADKTVMNLDIGNMMSLFLHLAKQGLSVGQQVRVTAFVPKGFTPKGPNSKLEMDKLIDDAIHAVFHRSPFSR